jgi:putative glutamine amidotransferase
MSKKIIAIPGWSTGDNSFGVTKPYLHWASQFGIVKILTPDQEYDDSVDMIILPGGLDVNPNLYNQTPGYFTSNTDVYKNHFLQQKLDEYIDNNKVVLGICLGLQQLAVKYGSELTQHLMYHEQSSHRTDEVHFVYDGVTSNLTLPTKPTTNINGFKVNSLHHQCVIQSNLSTELEPLLFSENYDDNTDHIVECFKHNTKKILAVQWHTEEIWDTFTRKEVLNLLYDDSK